MIMKSLSSFVKVWQRVERRGVRRGDRPGRGEDGRGGGEVELRVGGRGQRSRDTGRGVRGGGGGDASDVLVRVRGRLAAHDASHRLVLSQSRVTAGVQGELSHQLPVQVLTLVRRGRPGSRPPHWRRRRRVARRRPAFYTRVTFHLSRVHC